MIMFWLVLVGGDAGMASPVLLCSLTSTSPESVHLLLCAVIHPSPRASSLPSWGTLTALGASQTQEWNLLQLQAFFLLLPTIQDLERMDVDGGDRKELEQ